MLGSHLDITERKKTEERLREYEKIVEGLQEMIVVVDRQYRYLITNRAFLNYRQLVPSEVLNRPIPDILGQDVFHHIIKPRLDECFQGKVVNYEMRYTFPKLGERYLRVCYLPIEGPSGVDRVACVIEDITEREKAEQDLRQAHRLLVAELEERTRAEHQVRGLSNRLITAQEEERKSIARELHDDLSQQIATLSLSLSNLRRDLPEPSLEAQNQIEDLHGRILRLADGIRHLARKLHPAVLEYSGIAAALQAYGTEFGAVTGIEISVEAYGMFEDVPGPVGICLYRLAQEALQNVAKHSKAPSATVRIERYTHFISLVIKDSGVGFQPDSTGAARGLGLVSMSERVRLVSGTLTILSAPGQGTTLLVSVPL
jgi:PAS domain S-box-containing protein